MSRALMIDSIIGLACGVTHVGLDFRLSVITKVLAMVTDYCAAVQGKVVLPTMQASLRARKLGYWEIRGCCGRRWRDVNLKTPIYYKYYV